MTPTSKPELPPLVGVDVAGDGGRHGAGAQGGGQGRGTDVAQALGHGDQQAPVPGRVELAGQEGRVLLRVAEDVGDRPEIEIGRDHGHLGDRARRASAATLVSATFTEAETSGW